MISTTTTRGPRRRRLTWGGALCAALLLTAACGSDDDGDAAASTNEPSTTAGSSGSTTTAGGGGATDADWQAVVDAANDEGSLTVYSAAPPATNDLIAQKFADDFPDIHIEFLRINSQELSQRVVAEAQAGASGADALLTVIPTTQEEWADNGWLAPLTGPDVTSDAAAGFVFADGTTVNPASNVYGYAWNPNAVDGDLQYEDIASPDFDGRVGVYDWVAASTVAINGWIGETYGDDFLQGIADNDPQFYTSTVQMAQDLAAGVIDVATVMVSASAEGLPIELAYPERPAGLTYLASVMTGAAHPNAAQVWADWSMTADGQAAWAFDGVSALPDVDGALYSADDVDLMTTDYYDQAFQDEWTNKLNEIFHR